MECMWCHSDEAKQGTQSVYWELPDGTRAIEITNTPCVICKSCGMEYQEESIINEIEDQLMLIDTKQLDKKLSYEELLSVPKLLKRNYFRY
ncbi:YokU family protein [Fredinandcohnia humi]